MSKKSNWYDPFDVEGCIERSNRFAIPADGHGESLTVQSESDDTDINKIVGRYGIGAKMPENPRIPVFGDFSGISDFQSALNAIADAQDGFMELPASVRARFENNPQRLLEFCADDKNREEAVKLGLVKAPVAPVEAPGAPVVPVVKAPVAPVEAPAAPVAPVGT